MVAPGRRPVRSVYNQADLERHKGYRVGKGALRAVPTILIQSDMLNGGHAALCLPYPTFLHTMSFAAIRPPPAIRIAAMAIVALAVAKPARIRNAVDSSGVA